MSDHEIKRLAAKAQKTSKGTKWHDRVGTTKQQHFEKLRKALFDAVNSNPHNPVTKLEFCTAMQASAGMSKASAMILFKDIAMGGRRISYAKLDGYLDRTAVKYAIEKFRAAKGRDRYVDLKEFIKYMKSEGLSTRKAKRVFATVDTNRDGRLTLPEFRDWASELLKVQVIEEEFLNKASWPDFVKKYSVSPKKIETKTCGSKKPIVTTKAAVAEEKKGGKLLEVSSKPTSDSASRRDTANNVKESTTQPASKCAVGSGETKLEDVAKKVGFNEKKENLVWHSDTRAARTAKQMEYEELRKAIISACDTNGNGKVGKKEFIAALTNLSKPMEKKAADRLFHEITNGGFGTITTAKLDGYLDRTAVSYAIRKYRQAKGSDRYIDAKEFVTFMESEGLASCKARTLFCKVDENRDGKLTLKEFRDWASDSLRLEVIGKEFFG